jgi:predicted nucleic acid-binding protein
MEAAAHATGLSTMADVKSNQMIAEAQEEAAKAQASGSMMGSALGAIGSIGGALLMSDESTKHTVERIEDALATLRDLKPVTFYYKEKYSMSPERMHYGFIAQDYAKVMPDATYYDEELGKMCIDTSELIGLLVRSVQQLETRVARMEAANALVGAK